MASFKYPLEAPHSLSASDLFTALLSHSHGLSQREAGERLKRFGKNIVNTEKEEKPFPIFLRQLKSPMVALLAIASGLSFLFSEWVDGAAILTVVFINAVVGFSMEYQAGRQMSGLKRLTKIKAKVIREDTMIEIYSEEIVPGDILYMEAGDMIPADARLFSISQFQVDESSLTGESVPVEKAEAALEKNTALPERMNMVFEGTFVTRGNAKAIVTATGMQSELGKIAGLVQSSEQSITPLERKLEKFSRKLIGVTVLLGIAVLVAGILYGRGVVEMLQTSIALAVAAIPEGMPVVATLALARGMIMMARQKVIVKKLSAVETLGGTSVICTDKTGTLTQNKMEVCMIVTPGGRFEIKAGGDERTILLGEKSYLLLKKIAVLCNTAELVSGEGKTREAGDPLETALLKFALSDKTDIGALRKEHPKIKEEPFSSETKMMLTLHKSGETYFIAAKGAAEEILKRCSGIFSSGGPVALDENTRNSLVQQSEDIADSGLRVIAFAFRESMQLPDGFGEELVFAGLAGMNDPPAEGVKSAIEECRSAGIEIKMITGDHPATARNIARQLCLVKGGNETVIHGKDMRDYEILEAGEKDQWIRSAIFARVSPKQKLDIVKVLQEKKFVVAMTGDGVNDAPALKKADIGIAMGKRGTQVAREVADMVLKDDSFSSIVFAVMHGRVIFDNIRKFMVYLLSCNMSELFIVAAASVLDLHFRLFPLQILFINLVTDVLPALALGVTEGKKQVMRELPRNISDPILDPGRWRALAVYAAMITAVTFGAVFFSHFTVHGTEVWNTELCNNILFYTLIFSQLLHVFNMSSDQGSAFWNTEIFKNKYIWLALGACTLTVIISYAIVPVRNTLSVLEMTWAGWTIAVGFGMLSFLLIRLLKKNKIIL